MVVGMTLKKSMDNDMKDRYEIEIQVGDKVRVGLGGVLQYEVLSLDGGLVHMVERSGEPFTRQPGAVSVILRERK